MKAASTAERNDVLCQNGSSENCKRVAEKSEKCLRRCIVFWREKPGGAWEYLCGVLHVLLEILLSEGAARWDMVRICTGTLKNSCRRELSFYFSLFGTLPKRWNIKELLLSVPHVKATAYYWCWFSWGSRHGTVEGNQLCKIRMCGNSWDREGAIVAAEHQEEMRCSVGRHCWLIEQCSFGKTVARVLKRDFNRPGAHGARLFVWGFRGWCRVQSTVCYAALWGWQRGGRW